MTTAPVGGHVVDHRHAALLDDPLRRSAVDPADALGDVEASGAQWTTGRALAADVAAVDTTSVDQVVIAGMGGSGVVGDLVTAVAADRLAIPVLAHKGFGMPAFVGPRTLVIAVSYSGETPETVDAHTEALHRGAQTLAVASGGRLAAVCADAGLPLVTVPGGRRPRHSLGYLAAPALAVLGLDDGLDEAVTAVDAVVAACGRDVSLVANPAKQLAVRIATSAAVLVLGSTGSAGVAARRLVCQLAENAEIAAACEVLPEAGHNAIVSWCRDDASIRGQAPGLVSVRHVGERPEISGRFDALGILMAQRVAWSEPLWTRAEEPLAQFASLCALADLVSVYTAIALERDPTPTTAIDQLKAALADR